MLLSPECLLQDPSKVARAMGQEFGESDDGRAFMRRPSTIMPGFVGRLAGRSLPSAPPHMPKMVLSVTASAIVRDDPLTPSKPGQSPLRQEEMTSAQEVSPPSARLDMS